ncbi:MAG: hypothetical protein M0R74_05140 [Dehalococcoidia bacterium]|nr:hypothetical protein [Dehalococcoidia bacterium]
MANVVQVLTFRAYGVSQERLARQSDIISLATRDFPGAISSQCLTDAARNLIGGVTIWEDQEALDQFRHSELYARLMMSPLLEDGVDRAYDLDTPDGATTLHQPAALAA